MEMNKCKHKGFYSIGHTAECTRCGEKGLFCYMIDKLYQGKIQNYYKEMSLMYESCPEGTHRQCPALFNINKEEMK